MSANWLIRFRCVLLIFLICISAWPVFASPEFRSERLVTVKAGETLSEIVEREMRSAALWPAIARHNNIQDPTRLREGQVIRIPLIYTRSREHAIVLFVKGDVLIRSANASEKLSLRRGERINVGDEIFTGKDGFASVEFSSGSIINVQPESHIAIVDIACEDEELQCVIEIYTESGAVQSRVRPGTEEKVKFLINTPSGSAAVRGTVFDVNADNQRSVTGVTEGLVDFSAEGVTENLDEGYGVVARLGEPPGSPVPLLLEPIFLDIPPRLSTEDAVHWWENEDADAYQVQISNDSSADQVVSQIRVTSPVYSPKREIAGDYYLVVRPIDSRGLLGIPATSPIKMVKIEANQNIPELDIELLESVAAITLNQAISGVDQYEVQVAYDENFSQVLSSDIYADNAVYVQMDSGVKLFARARSLFSDNRVSTFGDVVSITYP